MIDLQLVYKLILVFLYAFFATLWSIHIILSKLRKLGHTVRDVYKSTKEKIPTMGGLAMMIGVIIALSLSQILIGEMDLGRLFIFYFVVLVYAVFGLLDDILGFKHRYGKILVILALSFPIASLIVDTELNFGLFSLELGWVYSLLLAPAFVMIVANLINLHSGYNGLVTGNAWLIVLFLIIKSYMRDDFTNLLFILPLFGALTAFYPYNKYPARALEGNVGAFLMGGAIGCFILVANIEWFGIFLLTPHIINFIMDSWTFVVLKKKDVKYGTIREDGTVLAPVTMKYKSLKFWIVSTFRLTEKQATYYLYIPTILFGIIGLFLF